MEYTQAFNSKNEAGLNLLELFAGSRSVGTVGDKLGMNVFSEAAIINTKTILWNLYKYLN